METHQTLNKSQNQEIADLEKTFQLSLHLGEIYEMRNTFQAILIVIFP